MALTLSPAGAPAGAPEPAAASPSVEPAAASPSVEPAPAPTPAPTVAPAPAPAPTSAAVATRPPAQAPATDPPAPRRNPRAATRVAAVGALWGPTAGVGVAAEYLPHWIASVGVGVGGALRMIGNAPVGAGTFFGELALLPVPFVVTPVIGGGFALTVGPLAEYLPGFAGPAPNYDQYMRLVPYARLGLRVDLRARLWLSGEVLLAPDNRFDQGNSVHPLPGLRIGYAVF